MNEIPVLIVGAGPVGLTAAVSLRQQGVSFRIIDRNIHRTEQSRAAVVHARTIEVLDHLGLADQAVAESAIIRGASISSPADREFLHGTFSHLESRFNFALGLSQPETERLLEESLAHRSEPVLVERGTELLDFRTGAEHVEADLRHADGRSETVRARYLIGADGSRSVVRHGLGFTLEGETLDVMWLTADVKMDWDKSREGVYQFFADGGFGFVGPLGADRWRLILASEKWSTENPPATSLEAVQDCCDRLGLHVRLSDPVWISTFGINTRLSPRFRLGRVFLVGDAAHVHSPAGGQGMNTGMQDAFNLAWKLAMVLRGEAGDALLESYHAERHANARRLLDAVGPATSLVSRHARTMGAILPHTVGLLSHIFPIGEKIAGVLSELEVAYPDSPITGEDGFFLGQPGPKPGERAAEVLRVMPDGRSLFQLWAGDWRHHLLVFGESRDVIDWAESFSGFPWLKVWLVSHHAVAPVPGLTVLHDTDGRVHRGYGMDDRGVVLVRPDGYVAWRARHRDAQALREFVRTKYF